VPELAEEPAVPGEGGKVAGVRQGR